MATVMMPNKPNIKERVRVCCPHSPPFLPTVNFTEPALATSITGWAPHVIAGPITFINIKKSKS